MKALAIIAVLGTLAAGLLAVAACIRASQISEIEGQGFHGSLVDRCREGGLL